MRKLGISALALTVVLAVAAVAVAQYTQATVSLIGEVTPTKAGTKKKPKNGKVRVAFSVNRESRTTISRIKYTLPTNVVLSGKGRPKCTPDAAAGGTCKAKSKIGNGTAKAVLPDGTALDFVVTVYANGAKNFTFFLDGTILDTVVEGVLTGKDLTVDIPPTVQQPITGLYAYVTDVDATLGAKPIKKKGKKRKGKKRKVTTYRVISVNGCPASKTHTFNVELTAVPNPDPPPQSTLTASDTAPCK